MLERPWEGIFDFTHASLTHFVHALLISDRLLSACSFRFDPIHHVKSTAAFFWWPFGLHATVAAAISFHDPPKLRPEFGSASHGASSSRPSFASL